MNTPHIPNDNHADHQRNLVVHIDRRPYKVDVDSMTGSQLRVLADPDIGPNYKLWLEVPGRDDIEVADDQVIELRNGQHFYSALCGQNPG